MVHFVHYMHVSREMTNQIDKPMYEQAYHNTSNIPWEGPNEINKSLMFDAGKCHQKKK